MHHAFLYISLPFLHDYDVKWPNFKFTCNEYGNGKVINSTISLWTRARSPLFSCNTNSLLFSSWVTWNKREMVWKDAESIFQRPCNGRHRCRIVRSLIIQKRSLVAKELNVRLTRNLLADDKTKSQLRIKQISPKAYISRNVTENKNELWKTVTG